MDNPTEKIDRSLPHFEARAFLASHFGPSPEADRRIAELLGWPHGPAYSSDLNAVVGELTARRYWWHLSHIVASVIPTKDAEGSLKGLMSNGARYDREGRPIAYEDHFADGRPAMALCTAAIKAAYDLPAAFYVVASHYEEVLSKEPMSTAYMMAYYRAREEHRLEAIAEWNARTSPSLPALED